MCAMNAAGGFIPPMFIFPRKRLNPLLEKDGPAGALYKCSDNGWINEQLFIEWLSHFKHHAKPSAEEPILLILDNHASHISLPVYEFCKLNHIHMLSLPPHTSHKMQPLDVSFYGPLKAAYKKECDLYMKSHLAEKITPYEVASLLRKAFNNVASISKGEAGFRATGIYPMNPDVFCEEDFLPAELLQSAEPTAIQDDNESMEIHRPAPGLESSLVPGTLMQDNSPLPTMTPPSTSSSVNCPAPEPSVEIVSTAPGPIYSPVPSTSRQVDLTVSSLDIVSKLIKLPEKTNTQNTRRGCKKQHATILTSTPIKESLIEKENKKKKTVCPPKDKDRGKGKNITKSKGKGQGKKTKVPEKGTERVKRKVLQESNDTSVSDVDTENLCQDDELDDADDAANVCLICNEFGRNNEVWYRCTSCGLWAHADCTGWESAKDYICDLC
ncbi:uncharacterized protein LOC121736227 [Aricia agestis]|uniref:uncharacterized protein LOC121736227 n=1 Tax=Aricia agestis TaxID=91739 RepID=UPI001C204755|nr:uncharacterized protein LOC121736227 [Aricia agestis]